MNQLFNIFFQTIKDKLPDMNWKIGSVVRSLLIDPLTAVIEELENLKRTHESENDLQSLLSSPVGKTDALDMWLRRLNISLPQPKQASGTLKIQCSSPDYLDIPMNTAFTWRDGTVVYAATSTTWGLESAGYAYEVVAPGVAYLAEIDVVSTEGTQLSLGAGEPINWSSAPNFVTDIYVGTPITGGIIESDQLKADLISAYLETPAVCGEDSMRSAIIRRFPGSVSDIILGSRMVNSTESIVPVYIKQTNIPENFSELPKQSSAVISWLNSRQIGSPFRIVGTVPRCASVTMQLDLAGSVLTSAAIGGLCDYVNSGKLNAILSDTDVSSILNSYGYQLNSPVVYTATININNNSCTVTQVGGLSLKGVGASSDIPYALYCSFPGIEAH